jgi:hypothetical protein
VRRVLLLEDDLPTAVVLRDLLEAEGLECAGSAEIAQMSAMKFGELVFLRRGFCIFWPKKLDKFKKI